MKKKILVCSLLVLCMLLTATTALAVNYDKTTLTTATTSGAGFTSSMRGINHCTETTVGDSALGHRCWLVDTNGNRVSSAQIVSSSVPNNYYLYPTTTGTLKLRLENNLYYNQFELHAVGTFTSSY